MGWVSRTTAPLAAACLIVAAAVSVAPTAASSVTKKPKPGSAASVTIEPLYTALNAQVGPGIPTVAFLGVDAKTKLAVNWGDGSPTERRKGPCSIKGATKFPEACSEIFEHIYDGPGDYTITAKHGKTTVQQQISIGQNLETWSPDGSTTMEGWSLLGDSATYFPCQTIEWYFDRSGESGDRNTMIDDVRAGLATLVPYTGLTFVEVEDPQISELDFSWGDLTERGSDVAGIGGFRGRESGFVVFSTNADWTLNKWSGAEWRRIEWPRPDLGPGWYSWAEGPGRQALVVHETMHALGFGHVEDFTSIMYPQGGLPNNRGQLSAGDIAGLQTMYLNNPCPVS